MAVRGDMLQRMRRSMQKMCSILIKKRKRKNKTTHNQTVKENHLSPVEEDGGGGIFLTTLLQSGTFKGANEMEQTAFCSEIGEVPPPASL